MADVISGGPDMRGGPSNSVGDTVGSDGTRGNAEMPGDVTAQDKKGDGGGQAPGAKDAQGGTAPVTAGNGSAHGGQGGHKQVKEMAPVTIIGSPPTVEIWLDDKRVGMGKVTGVRLPVGNHLARIHHPDCPACEDKVRPFEVLKDQPDKLLKIDIGYKPAVLSVESPFDGMVFLNNRKVGRSNEKLKIPAEALEPWEVELKVVFFSSEIPTFERKVTLQAGRLAQVATRAVGANDSP